jgi:hypothetical protein
MDDERDEKLGFIQTCATKSPQVGDIRKMSCSDLKSWLSRLTFMGADAVTVATLLSSEFVDGETFLHMTWEDLADMGIPANICRELDSIKTCVSSTSQTKISATPSADKPHRLDVEATDCSFVYGHLLTLGYKSYRVAKGVMCTPVGAANDLFTLRRQKSSVSHLVRLIICIARAGLLNVTCRLADHPGGRVSDWPVR